MVWSNTWKKWVIWNQQHFKHKSQAGCNPATFRDDLCLGSPWEQFSSCRVRSSPWAPATSRACYQPSPGLINAMLMYYPRKPTHGKLWFWTQRYRRFRAVLVCYPTRLQRFSPWICTTPFPSSDNDLFSDAHHTEWVCHLIEYHPEDSSLP